MSYVVTGATGHVGSALVDYLLGESVPIRVVIRSETKAESFRSRNIDVALADLYDAQALTRAFQGAKAVFVMNPTDVQGSDMFQSARQVSQAFAQVIQTAQVQRVVVLSSWGAEQPTKTGNILTAHILEEQLIANCFYTSCFIYGELVGLDFCFQSWIFTCYRNYFPTIK